MSGEENETKTKPFKGAQVLWPPDIPDDILEDAVTISAEALHGKSFEEGVEIARIVKQHLDKNERLTDMSKQKFKNNFQFYLILLNLISF